MISMIDEVYNDKICKLRQVDIRHILAQIQKHIHDPI